MGGLPGLGGLGAEGSIRPAGSGKGGGAGATGLSVGLGGADWAVLEVGGVVQVWEVWPDISIHRTKRID